MPELLPSIAAALSRLTLAEAQAVTAHRAELRGSSPSLVAALHVGTAGVSVEEQSFMCCPVLHESGSTTTRHQGTGCSTKPSLDSCIQRLSTAGALAYRKLLMEYS